MRRGVAVFRGFGHTDWESTHAVLGLTIDAEKDVN